MNGSVVLIPKGASVAELVGRKLKDFYVLRRLGRGAMAEVFLAQQLSLGRQVALKVLDAELARDPNYVRRFHHEARAAAALVHAGIVQIYEVGEENGLHYIAQEYVAGRNLGEVIRSRGSLPSALVLDILRQVAAALSKAASEGIVHRDIKPENIMLARSGEVKVADFGLARVAGDGGANLTQVGVAMGTPLYMSPEQIEGRAIDSRSDIYSLGVTAYHMLCGYPPFHGDTPLAVAVQHLNQPPVSPREKNPALPPRLVRVVERMMAKKPAERFSDPAALLAELNVVLAEGAQEGWAHADPDALARILVAADERARATTRLDELMKTTALVQPERKQQNRRRLLGAMAVAGALLLGGSLAAMLRPDPLLADFESGTATHDSLWGQLYHARLIDSEAAWLAVLESFRDENPYYQNLARQGLVYYYLSRSEEYEQAIRLLDEFKKSDNKLYRAFGTAGLVVAMTGLGEDELAYNESARMTPEMRTHLAEEAPRMAGLLDSALDTLAERAF